MFRPVRTLILVAVAFVAGILYERFNDSENCEKLGGLMTEGLCTGAPE